MLKKSEYNPKKGEFRILGPSAPWLKVLKLSGDLHLNEIDCVRFLVSVDQEWSLLGRDPSEILRLAAGLWYTERRDVITALYTKVIDSLLFSLVIALISDALSAVPDKVYVLSGDASFRRNFHQAVMIAGNDPLIEGFVNCIRLALTQDVVDVKEMVSGASSNNMQCTCSCLDIIFSNNVFQFWLDKILCTATYQG